MTASVPSRPPRVPRTVLVIGLLYAILAVFIVIRLVTDLPHITGGTVPDDDFAKRYVAHPLLTYAHIGLGVLYLLGAPFQLSSRFRSRHLVLHRRLGRGLVVCGLLSGTLAVVVGIAVPWGGVLEGSAACVFGLWLVVCLAVAYRAIRGGSVARHRAWMIRAFAVGVGVATIRIWVGLLTPFVLIIRGPEPSMPEPITFGIAFWLGLALNVAAGEWWLRRAARPHAGIAPSEPARSPR